MNNIIEIFQSHANRSPNKIAVIFEQQQYSYKTLESDIIKMSSYLDTKGVTKGSHTLVLLENSYEYVVLMLTMANLGSVLIPLNNTSKSDALNKAIKTTKATHIITNDFLHPQLVQMPLKDLNTNNIFSISSYANVQNNTLCKLNQNKVSPTSDYILTMTSGSTGDPKPIVFTQETKIQRSFLAARDLYRLNEDEVIIVASPLYHSLGQRLVLLPLLMGATCVLLKKFTPKSWIESVKTAQVTFTIAIASHLEILADEIANDSALTSLRSIVSSSSLLKTQTKAKCIEKFQCEFHECYGASEVGIVTNLSPKDAKKSIKSVGKALKFVDLKIVDDAKNEVKNGVIGEIICKTKTAFSRYYNNDIKTKESVVEGYFYTGDLGYVDKDGYLYLSGRKKDIIIVGGTNVYPVDIEDVILRVQGVKECSVIGIEDQYFTEAILAVLSVDESAFNLKDVKVACIKNLADYQQPMAFEVLKELPKNNLGKIMKHELRKMFQGYDATKHLRRMFQKRG